MLKNPHHPKDIKKNEIYFLFYFTIFLYTEHLKQNNTNKYWTQQNYLSLDKMLCKTQEDTDLGREMI